MATSGEAQSTATDPNGSVRRRNVESFQKANGGAIYKVEAEDTKKLQKVCLKAALPRVFACCNGYDLTRPASA